MTCYLDTLENGKIFLLFLRTFRSFSASNTTNANIVMVQNLFFYWLHWWRLGLLKFIYNSEKATKFCETSTLFWLYVVPVKISWRFHKILWPSQNIWTIKISLFSKMRAKSANLILASFVVIVVVITFWKQYQISMKIVKLEKNIKNLQGELHIQQNKVIIHGT